MQLCILLGKARELDMVNERMQLFIELHEIEQRGITLWLEGMPSNSLGITNAVFINEENAYMRDYIYDEGVLKELRFDKVSNN